MIYFREDAPISSSLNAIDLYLVMCIILVFGKCYKGNSDKNGILCF